MGLHNKLSRGDGGITPDGITDTVLVIAHGDVLRTLVVNDRVEPAEREREIEERERERGRERERERRETLRSTKPSSGECGPCVI